MIDKDLLKKSGYVDDVELEGLYSESEALKGRITDSPPTQNEGNNGDVLYVKEGVNVVGYKKMRGEWFNMGELKKVKPSKSWQDRRSPGGYPAGSTINTTEGNRVVETGNIYAAAMPRKPRRKKRGIGPSRLDRGPGGSNPLNYKGKEKVINRRRRGKIPTVVIK